MNIHAKLEIHSTMKFARNVMFRTRLLRAKVRKTRRYGAWDVCLTGFVVTILLVDFISASKCRIPSHAAVEHPAGGEDEEDDPGQFDRQAAGKLGAGDFAKEDGGWEVGQVLQ